MNARRREEELPSSGKLLTSLDYEARCPTCGEYALYTDELREYPKIHYSDYEHVRVNIRVACMSCDLHDVVRDAA